jgi:hypothetical protein
MRIRIRILNTGSPRGVAKHDLVACNWQIPQANLQAALNLYKQRIAAIVLLIIQI